MLKKELKWLFDEVPGLLMLIGLMLLALFIIFVPKHFEDKPSDFYIQLNVERPEENFREFDRYHIAMDGTGEVEGIKPPSAPVTAPVRYANNGYGVSLVSNEYISVYFPPIQLSFDIFPDAEDCRWPSFAPNSKWISMTCGTDIYIMEPNGENLHNLTQGEGINFKSLFSPDSQRIIFSSQRDELSGKEYLVHGEDNFMMPFTRLYSMALNGGDIIPLTFRMDENIRIFSWFQE